MKLKPSYSNNASREFWRQVNSLKNKSDWQELYSLGVALQNMESFVLQQLETAKNNKPEKNAKQ